MTTERRCLHCDTPLAPGSRSDRRYCSSPCRVRAWDLRNPPPAPDPFVQALWAKSNPKHYHLRDGIIRILVGHISNVPWFGNACPPECPGLGPDETFAPMEPYDVRVKRPVVPRACTAAKRGHTT